MNPGSYGTPGRAGTAGNLNTASYGKLGAAGSPGNANKGLPGSVANLTKYNDISINPFQLYDVVVPDGGFITVRWYAQ